MFKVMIIEDEEILRFGLMSLINWHEEECHVVYAAENGADALDVLLEVKPDIIVLDVNMPIMNGLEFLEKASELAIFRPIIISGYSDFEYAQQAISFNVVSYLLKPLESDLLIQALRKAKKEIENEREKDYVNPGHFLYNEFSNFNEKDADEEIQYILNYIEENFTSKISIEDLIPMLNRGKTYLNKKFRENVGTSFNEYLNLYRVQQAIKLIRQTNNTLGAISESVGFNTYKNFVKTFKKYTNVVPKEFVKKRGPHD